MFVERKIDRATVVSFDIFDTAIYRVCPPKDVHFITGARMTGPCVTSPMRFYLDRICAEDIANRTAWTKGRDAATLKEIYESLPVLLPMWVELEVEMEVSRVNPEVKRWYDRAVRLGKRVVFASDMYLPAGFLNSLLAKHGYEGKVFVSCEVGCKTTGRLWPHLLDGMKPRDVFHIGDHFKGDVLVPSRLGIKTHYYRRKA